MSNLSKPSTHPEREPGKYCVSIRTSSGGTLKFQTRIPNLLSSEFRPLFVFPSSVPLSPLLFFCHSLSLFLVLCRHCDYAARLIVKMKNPGAESKSEKTHRGTRWEKRVIWPAISNRGFQGVGVDTLLRTDGETDPNLKHFQNIFYFTLVGVICK